MHDGRSVLHDGIVLQIKSHRSVQQDLTVLKEVVVPYHVDEEDGVKDEHQLLQIVS